LLWGSKIHLIRFSVTSRRRRSRQLVADLVVTPQTVLTCQDVADKSAASGCNGIWETTRHNMAQRTFARSNLLRTCDGEATG